MAKKNLNKIDKHHLLWSKNHWSEGYAKLIREHPACCAYIPQASLHRKIHEFIGDISLPPDNECKKAYIKLESYYKNGKISDDSSIDRRICVLIRCFKFSKQTKRDLERQLKIVQQYENRP